MLIPFDESGFPPPGWHPTTLPWFVYQFGYSAWRLRLLSGWRAQIDLLMAAKCRKMWYAGSFVSVEPHPNDIDGAWLVDGVDLPRLAKAAPAIVNRDKAAMRDLYGCEIYPVTLGSADERALLEFYSRSKQGIPRGLATLDLEAESQHAVLPTLPT